MSTFPSGHAAIRAAVCPLSLFAAVSCSGVKPAAAPGPEEGRVVVAAEIEQMSAVTAWEIIERSHTRFQSRSGDAGDVRSSRGRRSFILLEQAVVILDGARVDPSLLRQLPATMVGSVRFLTGLDATTRYGTGAAHGAIIIETRSPAR